MDWGGCRLGERVGDARGSPVCPAPGLAKPHVPPTSRSAGRVGATFPPLATIEAWRDRYLRVWEDGIDELDPDEDYRAERRQVLDRTFERAVELAHKRQQ